LEYDTTPIAWLAPIRAIAGQRDIAGTSIGRSARYRTSRAWQASITRVAKRLSDRP
jgi:hypothetical protein